MTLTDLICKAKSIAIGLSDSRLPIMKDGLHVKFDLEIEGNADDGYHIEIVNYKEGEE